jgi:hypothetical protein
MGIVPGRSTSALDCTEGSVMAVQRKEFSVNDRVLVSSSGGWKQSASGVICGGPDPVETLQGSEYFYWVLFDEPQEDVNGPDKYSRAQILSCYLEAAL